MRSCKVVSESAIDHNLQRLGELVGGVPLCPVLKSDAYGHGLETCLARVAAHGVRSVAVADLEEVAAVPPLDLDVRCLLPLGDTLASTPMPLIDEALQRGIILSAATPGALLRLAARARVLGVAARVDLMVDTGLARGDAAIEDFIDLVTVARRTPHLRLESLATHLASADAADLGSARAQVARFERLSADLPGVPRHAANTAAALRLPESRFDMVRPGLGIYGIAPPGTGQRASLRPAMRWETEVARVYRVRAGDGVGYGATWRAPADTCVALLPVGYADGLPRRLSNRGAVVVGGRPRRIVGAVSMNLTVIEIGAGCDVAAGDRAVLLDDRPDSQASAYRWAELLDTVPHEVLTSVGGGARPAYAKKSLPLSSTTMNAGKSRTSMRQTDSMPRSS